MEDKKQLWKYAFLLALATVIFNMLEGSVSLYFGIRDETLTLMGFGLDSFIETISSVGILHMVYRVGRDGQANRDKFERQALRITGWCLYALSIILTLGAIVNIVERKEPTSTVAGAIIASISILLMILLIKAKNHVGKALGSTAIVADAKCNVICVYMSIVLLIASGAYYFLRIPYIDAIGAIAIAWFSFREGKESLEKARNSDLSHCC